MARNPNINWRDKDLKEMQRIVKNYNAKISRLEKKNPDIKQYLPERVSMKSLKSNIETRKEFNRELNSLKRFSKNGVEKIVETPKGLKLTEYEIKEVKNKVRIVNIKRTAERKKLGFSPERGTMGQISERGLQPKNFSLNKTPKEWERYLRSLKKELSSNFKQDQLEKYKENYLKGITNNFGTKGEELATYLENIDAETLYNNAVADSLLTIDFIYDPLEAETIINAKLNAWKKALK